MRGTAAIAAVLAIAAGCSAGTGRNPDDFSGGAYAMAMTDSRALAVEVHFSPQPPARGTNDALLVVTDAASGAPIEGLTVAIQPWMPAMNHGTFAPTITPQGEGRYLVTNLNLFMPGLWALRTTFTGAASDHVVPQFQVP